MKVEQLSPAFVDARGAITDVLLGVPVEHVAHLTCAAGSVRGNHYHLRSTAYIYVLSGTFWISARTPVGDHPGFVERHVATAGCLVTIPPLERHALKALEDSSFLMLTTGPDGGRQFETDTVREEP